MIAAIMQPTYLPWIGYFDLIDTADQFVFLDDAQVLKRSWGVRNRVIGQNGETFLTVPLSGHSQTDDCTFINTSIDPGHKWRKTHLATIRHSYGKAPHFAEVFADLEAVLSADNTTIGALNEAFIKATAERIGIQTPFLQSSKLDGIDGRKDHRLLSICRKIGAQTYLSAQGSAAYIEQTNEGGAFAQSGVELRYHNFAHPVYSQTADGFVSHLSIVDLLMNCGYASALEIIRSGRREMLTSAELKEEVA
ncbi:MAG: WbqC family protein [Pseudomonadota bacterium]